MFDLTLFCCEPVPHEADERPEFMGVGMLGGPNDPQPLPTPVMFGAGALPHAIGIQNAPAQPVGPIIDPSLSGNTAYISSSMNRQMLNSL